MTIQDAFYEKNFENGFLRATGQEFQSFFERLMGLRHKTDFLACRPWGREGDRKNDGFLKSERRLFQVYAPNDMTASVATRKINEDFSGAKKHWGEYFDNWTFVHNAIDGLPPHVHDVILAFERANPELKLEVWSLPELCMKFRELSEEDKASWFGPVPTDETKHRMSFGDLQVVLEQIATHPTGLTKAVGEVPPRKLEANALSSATITQIKEGMIKTPLVSDFLSQWHDETLGDRIAEAFTREYLSLRNSYVPNQVFHLLQSWVGGERRGTPEHELAVVTVIAYYFERCDIFEEPRGDEL